MARNSQADCSAKSSHSRATGKKSKSKSRSQRPTTLKLTKSPSGSTERTSRKYLLSRLLKKKNISVRETVEDDLKWFWAAYNKGAWDDFFEKGLDKNEFVERTSEIFAGMIALYTVFKGDTAIGVVFVVPKMFMMDVYQEPHVSWFPWAKDRDILEGSVRIILKMRDIGNVFIQVQQDKSNFVTHLAKYGILRRVGTLTQREGNVSLYEAIRSV